MSDKLFDPFEIKVDGVELSVVKVGYDIHKAYRILNGRYGGKPQDALKVLLDAYEMATALEKPIVADARKRGLIAHETTFAAAFEKFELVLHGIEQYASRGTRDRDQRIINATIRSIKVLHGMFANVLAGDPEGMDAKKNEQGKREKGVTHGLGFRHITLKDFKKWGVGGGR